MNFCNTSCFPSAQATLEAELREIIPPNEIGPAGDADMEQSPIDYQLALPPDELLDYFPTSILQREWNEEFKPPNPGNEWMKELNAVSQTRMYLSCEEVIYLMKNGQLMVRGKTVSDLWQFYFKRDGIAFMRRYFVYE
jgi:hypothetical protein